MPVLVDASCVRLRWGFMSELVVERANVAKVVAGEMEAPKGETADLSSLGGAPCWIVPKSPVAFKPLLGRERAVAS